VIALDAMGGDYAPHEIVIGAINAAKKGVAVTLFGDQNQIAPLLVKGDYGEGLISIHHCSDAIEMGAVPTSSIIKQKNSSLVQSLYAVSEGRAQAVVTAGNSGAALIGGTLILGRVPGVLRPAIGEFFPTQSGQLFCLDLGANVDCKAQYLYQFALMGHVYTAMTQGIANPRIALLSNGAEPYKGCQAVKDVYYLLEKSGLRFIGNIEPRDIFELPVDVVVCDGFVGNILLKTIQGTVKTSLYWMQQEMKQLSWWQRLLLRKNRDIVHNIKKKTAYQSVGASLLLGVNSPLLVAHGCSRAEAIENALLRAHRIVEDAFIARFNKVLTDIIFEHSAIDVGIQSVIQESVNDIIHAP
jgi:glycerol-3-phosphate acyltransferase PlsX